jgi:hypothetical protein
MNLTARDDIFREVVQLPRLVAVLSHMLGEDYILSDVVSLTPLPVRGCLAAVSWPAMYVLKINIIICPARDFGAFD